MATRTSLYSFRGNIIEIGISVDPIGAVHGADVPITEEERKKYGLLSGKNPWKHLGVPDFIVNEDEQVVADTAATSSSAPVQPDSPKVSSIEIEELKESGWESHRGQGAVHGSSNEEGAIESLGGQSIGQKGDPVPGISRLISLLPQQVDFLESSRKRKTNENDSEA
jgi:hypothetical protein